MVKFKFFNLYALIMNPLLMHSFIAIFTGHLENIGSVSYSDLPNFDTFHFTIAKITFIDIIINLIRKLVKY